jgi:AcrR family transcriptional regulator
MVTKDVTQARLLEVAAQVFAEKGFEGATVREICQRADANIAAVNYYFRDKEKLYIEAVKSACHCADEETPFPTWLDGTDPRIKLRDFIHTQLRRMLSPDGPSWHRQLLLRELAQPTAACAAFVQDHVRPSAAILGSILDELVPHLPERKRRLLAFSIVGQCFFHRVAQPILTQLVGEEEYRAYDTKTLADHITEFSLAALAPHLKLE